MDKECKKEYTDLLLFLLKLQEHTAPIHLSIGYTLNGFVQKGIMIHEAPPMVIDALVEKGYACDLTKNGLLVYTL